MPGVRNRLAVYSESLTADSVNWSRVGVAVLVGLVPIWLEAPVLLSPGYPSLGDGLSNLFPVVHARHSFSNFALPVYTSLWYGGEFQPFNALWKGLYPPWWPLYVPGVPIFPAVKAILGVHYFAAGFVAYWFASDEFEWYIAAPFALLFVTPMALFNGHYEKVLSWPWLVTLVWQLRPGRLETRRHGLVAGVCLGAMLLAGGMYYFFHGVVLIGCVLFFMRERSLAFLRGLLTGSLVGLPKIVVSILPSMLLGTDRPHGGEVVNATELLVGLTGYWVDLSELTLEIGPNLVGEGYYPIGLGAIVLGGLAFLYGYVALDRVPTRWLLGVGCAGLAGMLLASHWSFLYNTPVVTSPVSMFRVAARATNVVALSLLLGTWFTLTRVRRPWKRADRLPGSTRSIVVGASVLLLLVSGVGGVWAWHEAGVGSSSQTTVGEDTAEYLASIGADSVWFEGKAKFSETPEETQLPYQKAIAYELMRMGVPVQAVNYGKFGQEYRVRENGELTFDTLLVGARLPEDQRIPLTGGWWSPKHGEIDTGNWERVRTIQTDRGPIYVYRVQSQSHR